MRSDAAAALDHVAEIQEAAGRLPEAADTLRRAVELEEAPERIRRQRALIRQIRFSSGDHAAEHLLARALRLRDEPAGDALRPAAGLAFMASQASMDAAVRSSESTASYRASEREQVAAAPSSREQVANLESDPEPSAAETAAQASAPEPQSEPVAVAPEPEPEPLLVGSGPVGTPSDGRSVVGVMAGVDGPSTLAEPIPDGEAQPCGDDLLAAAEAAETAGDAAAAHSLLLGSARAYAREGLFDAALDATHRLLQRTPGDVDAHLVLVDLYVARSWDGLAADKLRLLGRIAKLEGDEETRQRLCVAATRAFPKDPALQNLCA
jgi:tetratricopeptide (TPR) repeat protein